MTRAFVVAAPSSGAGKTVLSLGLMAACRARGLDVRAAKSGPDYIDPAFHALATGAPSVNLDAWAMGPDMLCGLARDQGGEILIIEAAMGVLDGAIDGRGSAADLAQILNVPVILVVDAAKTGQSAALAPAGLRTLRPDLNLAGVILNRTGSDKHETLARAYLPGELPFLGAMPRDPQLMLPERHLGLVQASETAGITDFLDRAAALVERNLDLDRILDAATPISTTHARTQSIPPLGQRIAVARDVAFSFAYPHLLASWQNAGAEIFPFSPLADEPPNPTVDSVFLPGGYPELHAPALAAAGQFRQGMQAAANRNAVIYGECGGYMVLGKGLVDANGTPHEMTGLLPLETSFEKPKMTLGYRKLTALAGPFDGSLFAHEFHYATTTHEDLGQRLFAATDAGDTRLSDLGLVVGNTSGSFAHVIAPVTL